MKKLSIAELNMIYGGARVVSLEIDKDVYNVGLYNNDLEEIVSITISSKQENWQFIAAFNLCIKCWGTGTNTNLYKAIDDWMCYPDFCLDIRKIVNQEPIQRVRMRLRE